MSGLMSSSIGSKFLPEDIRKIKIGVTTKPEMYQMFGAPRTVLPMGPGSEMWMYVYSKRSGSVFIISSMQTDSQSLTITFKDDIVSDCTVSGKSGDLLTTMGEGRSSLPCEFYHKNYVTP